jgi:hypothetical protein
MKQFQGSYTYDVTTEVIEKKRAYWIENKCRIKNKIEEAENQNSNFIKYESWNNSMNAIIGFTTGSGARKR